MAAQVSFPRFEGEKIESEVSVTPMYQLKVKSKSRNIWYGII